MVAQLKDLEGVWYNYTLSLVVSFENQTMYIPPVDNLTPVENVTNALEKEPAQPAKILPISKPPPPTSFPGINMTKFENKTVVLDAKPPTMSLSKVS